MIKHALPCLAYLLRWALANSLLQIALNCNPTESQESGITDVSHHFQKESFLTEQVDSSHLHRNQWEPGASTEVDGPGRCSLWLFIFIDVRG
jgi:hypothetical protein